MDLRLTEIPLLSHQIPDGVWTAVIYKLSARRSGSVGDFDLLFHRQRWLVLAVMIRKKWDSKFYVPRLRGEIKQGVYLEADLFVALLNLISETFLLEPHYGHPALWFMNVVLELEFSPTFPTTNGATDKTTRMARVRSQNKILLSPESLADNPFEQSATKLLLNKAIHHALQKDRFRTTSYTPFVRARMALTSFVAAHPLFIKDQQGSVKEVISRQGRRKKDELKS